MKFAARHVIILSCSLLFLTAAWSTQGHEESVLDAKMHHLGNDATPEWPEAPADPEPAPLAFEFKSTANDREWTLGFSQRNINNTWKVAINGSEVVTLDPSDGLIEVLCPVPARTLRDGSNHFELTTDQPEDDITFGRVRLIQAPYREVLNLRPVSVSVTSARTGEGSPARVSITTLDGAPVQAYFADSLHQAARLGVVYTDRGVAQFELPVGAYRIFATRGPEWSLAEASLTIQDTAPEGEMHEVRLAITREVDTTGYVACDTHIHTLTFSGHGDSSVEERLVTLAGEGVELAISTDHNHNTDYRPYQERLGLSEYFTTVVGNEVTTPIGHFNGFPLSPDDEVPPHDLTDLITLVDGIRARGALAVVLNHPRWPAHETGPFGVIELNHFTGSGKTPALSEYPFDAMELANSCTEEKSPMLLFQDWFSLLNRGEHVFAVGSSDSHTVGRPVGGGRTYVRSVTDDPALIDVDAACKSIAEGRTSLSMGIYVEGSVRVPGDRGVYASGDVVPASEGIFSAHLRVQAASWVRPREATLFYNGKEWKRFQLSTLPATATDLELECGVSAPSAWHDAWIVWVVTGDGTDDAYWPLVNDYTLGATNPVFLDSSGDGEYQSPRETAIELVRTHGTNPSTGALRERLAEAHESVLFHALDVARTQLLSDVRVKLHALGAAQPELSDSVEELLRSYDD